MAASQAPATGVTVADLRELRGDDLAPILSEQMRHWLARYQWDFSPSAAVLQRFLDSRNLHGHALICAGRAVGYSYFLYEDGKALIGDLYVLEAWRDPELERMLFERTLRSAALYPGVRRIEGQLLAISFQPRQQILFERRVEIFPRLYMLHRDLDKIPTLGPEPEDIRFLLWSDGRLDTAAELIAEAYVGHVDGRINDQYRSYTGARRFLTNTTQHTGCGEFLERASLLALQPMSYKPEGLCLASRIDHATGHITQLCVGPRRRRGGIGAQLLSRSMLAQRELGINTVTLTVTENNTQAVKLYERFQFTVARRFPAFVWETP